MPQTAIQYVEKTAEGGWRLANTRVSLDSIVVAHLEGKTPEEISALFSSVSTQQVYGAIAFYLGHQGELDKYLARQNAIWNELQQASETDHAALLDSLRIARESRSDAEDDG